MPANRKLATAAILNTLALSLFLLAVADTFRAQATAAKSIGLLGTDGLDWTAAAPTRAIAAQPPASDAEATAATPSVPAATTASESDWHFTVSPYLWFPGVHGNVGDPNGGEIGFSASPGDLLSHFRFGLMGAVEPRYKRIVMPLDIMWIRLGDDRALPHTPGQGVANLKGQEFILTQKLGYRVIDQDRIKSSGIYFDTATSGVLFGISITLK